MEQHEKDNHLKRAIIWLSTVLTCSKYGKIALKFKRFQKTFIDLGQGKIMSLFSKLFNPGGSIAAKVADFHIYGRISRDNEDIKYSS